MPAVKTLESIYQKTFEEHVGASAFNSNGSFLAIGRLSGCLSLHNSNDGSVSREFNGRSGGIHALAYSPDGRWLAVGRESGILEIIPLDSEQSTQSFDIRMDRKSLSHWIDFVVWSEDSQILAASCGSWVIFIDAEEMKILSSKDCKNTITSLSSMAMENKVLVACNGGVWFLSFDGEKPDEFMVFDGVVLKAVCSPTLRYVNAGLLESSVAIWDRHNDEPLVMRGYERKVSEMDWSPMVPIYRKQLFAAGGGRTITIWDFTDGPPDGQMPLSLMGHQAKVNDLRFMKKRLWLLSAGQDGELRIWQGSRNWQAGDVFKHTQPLHQIFISGNEDRILVTGSQGRVWLYKL
ncbi:MAG: hypothetical protein M3Q07_25540 [Pseudobdellovibrionaceae bacterium]|nr:hypothetical protein [Pseudobdellovibrionaceae bacterium]